MSQLQQALRDTLSRLPSSLDRLSELIDPAWIKQALHTTGKARIRRRKLPAEHAVWLVIGLPLFRNLPIWHVIQQLGLLLDGHQPCAPSASVQARQRLGDEPLAELFSLLTQAWPRPSSPFSESSSLRLLAVDGVIRSVPDTPDNRQAFGSTCNQYGQGGGPQIRAVCLMDTYSHELLDAHLGG